MPARGRHRRRRVHRQPHGRSARRPAASAVRVIDNLVGGRAREPRAARAESAASRFGRARHAQRWPSDDRCSRGVDYVFHFAGIGDIVPSIERPLEYMSANVNGTVARAGGRAPRRVDKFVYARLVVVLRPAPRLPTTRATADRSRSIPTRSASTWASRRRSTGHQVYRLPVNSIRIFNAYGHARRAPPAPTARCSASSCAQKLARASRSRWSATAPSGATSSTSPTWRDAFLRGRGVRAHGAAVCNLGAGNPQSVNRLVELLGGEVVHLPKRPGEPDCTWADVGKIQPAARLEARGVVRGGRRDARPRSTTGASAPLWTPESIESGHAGLVRTRCRRTSMTMAHRRTAATQDQDGRGAGARHRPAPAATEASSCATACSTSCIPGHLRHLMYAKAKARRPDREPHRRRAHHQGQLPAATCRRSCARSTSPRSRWSTTSSSTTTPRRSRTSSICSPTSSPRATSTSPRALPPKTQEEIDALESYGGEIDLHARRHRLLVVAADRGLAADDRGDEAADPHGRRGARPSIDLRDALDELSASHACTSSATPSSTATRRLRMIGGHGEDADHERALRADATIFIGGAAVVAKHLRAAGGAGGVLDRARQRRAARTSCWRT